MDISKVITQLRTYCPSLKIIGGSADFNSGLESVVNPSQLPAAYVIPDGDEADANQLSNALLQLVRERIQIVVQFDNSADRRGYGSVNQVDAMKYALFSAILNWRIDPTHAQRGLEYDGCEFIAMDRGRLWYGFRFSQELTITNWDGFQETGVDLTEIDVTVELNQTPPVEQPVEPPAVNIIFDTNSE
jgi:hypothetical protein